MRVLVFGAGGFLGSAIGRSLAAAGHQVAALARDADRAAAFAKQGWEPVTGDLSDIAALRPELDKADGVAFAASIPFDQEWPVASAFLDALAGSGKPFVQTTGT